MDPPTFRPLSVAATASEAVRPRGARWRLPAVRSLRVRLTLYLTGLLALTAGILLLFVNAAAHLARPPITDLPVLVNGEVYNAQVVNAAQVRDQEEALSRLRIFSLVGFVGIVVGGAAIGSVIAGRALQPVTEMAEVAGRITDRNLKERIDPELLDDELHRLASAFNDMVDRLDAAFEHQRQFVGDASHELRTPLTALQVSLDSVRADPQASPGDYRQLADEAAAATARMRRLVEDLLALAETDRPATLGPLSVSSIVDMIVEEMEPLAEQRSVSLSTTVPPGLVVVGDQLGLRRAVTNLVENAIRYNREGGHVVVEQVSSHPGWVSLAVRDDGVGIPPAEQSRIFDRFYRIDRSRSRADGGSGLGLSIVAKIVAEHGGRIDVESMPGSGSRFILTLPAPAPAQPTAA